MSFQLQDTQKVTVTAVGVNAVGNPVPAIYGPATWEVSDPNLLEVVTVGNFSCQLVTKGPLGSAKLTAHAFSDAAKTAPIAGTLDIDVVASPATGLRLDVGTPEVR